MCTKKNFRTLIFTFFVLNSSLQATCITKGGMSMRYSYFKLHENRFCQSIFAMPVSKKFLSDHLPSHTLECQPPLRQWRKNDRSREKGYRRFSRGYCRMTLIGFTGTLGVCYLKKKHMQARCDINLWKHHFFCYHCEALNGTNYE